MSQEIKLYELLYLVPGSLSEQEITPILEHVRSLITAQEGVIVREDAPARRKLAYPIKQYSHGFYVLIYFEALPSVLNELNTTLTHAVSILRHVLIQTHRMTDLVPQYSLTDQNTDTSRVKDRAPAQVVNEPLIQTKSDFATAPEHDTKPSTQEPEQVTEKQEPSSDTKDTDEEVPTKKAKAPKQDKKSKISLDDLDEKLDEILTSDTL
ncbi:MAG TPA: 30S ribosomal protein S6 [Patescibacteria group bacterium]|nr:30S ribosomal protein S6 [Patescibacteria group bacterium]